MGSPLALPPASRASTFARQPLLNIHDVAVHPAHRGHGIGKQLLAEAERLAREPAVAAS